MSVDQKIIVRILQTRLEETPSTHPPPPKKNIFLSIQNRNLYDTKILKNYTKALAGTPNRLKKSLKGSLQMFHATADYDKIQNFRREYYTCI